MPIRKCNDRIGSIPGPFLFFCIRRKDFAAFEKQVIFDTQTELNMIVLEKQISMTDLTSIAEELYGDMVKAVADVAENTLAIDAELHSDLERLLLENGSLQDNLWGFNIYPGVEGEDFIEFDSLINIRPRQNNRSRYVESGEIREKITKIVNRFICR